jgi:hypothetical protein
MKRNVASQVIGAQLVSATTGAAFTSAVTVYVTGDAGTQAAGSVGSGACTHEGNGFHTYTPAQAETNYDHVAFTFTGTGAIPATVQVYTTFPQTGDSFARLGAPAGASVSADVAAVKAETALIVADTNELQTDWANGGRLDVILDARSSQTSVDDLPTNAELATALGTADDAVLTAIDALPTNAELATALGTADDAVLAQIALVKAVTDKLDDTLEDDAGTFRFTANALEESPTGGSAPTASAIADEVQTRTIAAVTVVNGLAANVITAAATAADFTTEIQSGLATAAAVADLPTNAELATALGTADDAVLAAIDALPTATENADALLNRDMSAVSDTNSRSPLNALRFLRNKWSIAGTDLTVTKENDSTAAWTATVTAAPGADPISGSDPA